MYIIYIQINLKRIETKQDVSIRIKRIMDRNALLAYTSLNKKSEGCTNVRIYPPRRDHWIAFYKKTLTKL